MSEISALLGRSLGLSEDDVEVMRSAAPLHDIGMLAIPDRILLQCANLNDEDREQIKTHIAVGASMLSGSHFDVLRMAEDIAYYHHEHWDGTGYHGYSEELIPLPGRIVAVVDRFDVLTHGTSTAMGLPVEEALGEIEAEARREFDPKT